MPTNNWLACLLGVLSKREGEAAGGGSGFRWVGGGWGVVLWLILFSVGFSPLVLTPLFFLWIAIFYYQVVSLKKPTTRSTSTLLVLWYKFIFMIAFTLTVPLSKASHSPGNRTPSVSIRNQLTLMHQLQDCVSSCPTFPVRNTHWGPSQYHQDCSIHRSFFMSFLTLKPFSITQ